MPSKKPSRVKVEIHVFSPEDDPIKSLEEVEGATDHIMHAFLLTYPNVGDYITFPSYRIGDCPPKWVIGCHYKLWRIICDCNLKVIEKFISGTHVQLWVTVEDFHGEFP